MSYSNRTAAGALLFAGMVIFIIGLNVAEELYPGYSVSMNYISDLGATCRGSDCQIFQPSSMIFNTSVFVAGLFAVVASYLLWLELRTRLFPVLLALAGIGAMGVGLFPEYHVYLHYTSAFLAFIFGGIAAIAASTIVKSVLRYFSIVMGIMTLAAFVLTITHHYMGLGPGGMERMILYPFALWAMGFGGYLMQPCGETSPVSTV
ncbi:MAG TPA: DUF998 domain-containing protein [Methanotrichaceae archaeon]|nr:DUF998 domain-containing protein [Methanotrichaceae archaeon]